MHPKVNIKQIVIALIDRLASYAAREAENEDPEETKRQEEAAARRLAERVKLQKSKARENGGYHPASPSSPASEVNAWGSPSTPATSTTAFDAEKSPVAETPTAAEFDGKGKDKEGAPVRKFRGVPEDVQLFEVFWKQVVELIKVRSCPAAKSPQAYSLPSASPGSSRSFHTRHHGTLCIFDKFVIELLPRQAGICRPGSWICCR